MNNGWIKVYRQFINWEWYKDSNVKDLFIHLLLLANHSEGKWQGIPIERGQLITSVAHLTDGTNLSRSKIRRALKKLEKTKEITIKTTNKYTVITIENYDRYQDGLEEANQQTANKEPRKNQQMTTNKNEKKEKNKKNKNNLLVKEKFNKPTLEEIEKYILEKKYNVDADYFYNYYEANGWKVGKNKMKSWKACIVTWNKRSEKEKTMYKPKYNNYEQRKYENLNSLYTNFQEGVLK